MAAELLGWEWAPPPLPEHSPKRQLEPQWQEPFVAPREPGMDEKVKAILLLAGGGVLLLAAASSRVWLLFSLPLLIYGGVMLVRVMNDPTRPENVAKARQELWAQYQWAHSAWDSEVQRDEAEAQRRFVAAPRWYPIARIEPRRRVDVFGGGPEGWASLMHNAFTPALSQGVPMTVLDLTRRQLARRALWPDASPGTGPLTVAMPSRLMQYDPLAGVQDAGNLAALLTESEGPNDDWARRDIERAIFRRTADVLGENVTLPRLLAAVTTLLGVGSATGSDGLSGAEREALLDPNFTAMLGGDSAGLIGRVSAALEAVVRGSRRDPADADAVSAPGPLPFFAPEGPVIVAAEPVGDPESRRRLDNLLAASLVDRISGTEPCPGLVLVVGADRLARAILDELTTRAEERGLHLVMFFEHLRGEARELLGRGTSDTIVMRLGNYEDATSAANFIGKEHRFVVSSITLTVGTQFGGTDTSGFSVTDSESVTDTRSTSKTDGGILLPASRTTGKSTSTTSGRSTSTSFSYSETWAETENYGETSTRSEEFVARAEDIQRVPTTGLIYVTAVRGRQHVIFGDCHPAIAESPMVASEPIARG